MRKRKWIIILGGSFLTLLLIVNIFASNFFYNLAIKSDEKDFLVEDEDLVVSASAMNVFLEGGWREWVNTQPFKHWELESFDGLKLKGYYLESEEVTDQTVVFAHGYLGRGRDMALYGQYYYEELGYNVLLSDLRGHGDSEGEYIGFGWHDRLDLIDWVNRVVEHQGPETEIVLHGLSMGAAAVLMASGEDLPDQVKAIVADSGYTGVYDLFEYQMDRMYNLPSFPVLPTTSLVTKVRADYSLKEASALDQVKQAEVPILYIHGKKDAFVPTSMTEELYEATNSEAQIKLFEDAGHGEAFAIYEEAYVEKLNDFLYRFVSN
ncbi:alpha/beta hydrolase [Alkalibacillus haloalkaliphilus]|uniref:alpha/beta hydrolase n=1 Tax=Alkalibacillus haloalkaliphilus TaxID=94136 RepID=UPI0029365682|nr:alpha/beta hydrolase [Alkalibacillus haloalkaliphilus]MDV2582452.1 alpha/beta hydrolase [Alkalibacillus haloalkaliphilus]